MRLVPLAGCATLLVFVVGCGSDDPPAGSSGTGATAGSGGSSFGGTSSGGASSGGTFGAAGGSAGTSSGGSGGSSGDSAAEWILAEFASAPLVTGNFTARTTVETPSLVKDATACCAKYAFDMREEQSPDDRRVGMVNVTITNLESSDAFGGGIQTASAAGLVTFMANVHVEPNWPTWVSYATTNKDGLVLDGSAAIYAADLTIKNWNADGAIDNKALVSQFVRLKLEGAGHRGIRYWQPGPHYIVDSQLENSGGFGEGSLLWFSDCDGATVKIYASTFNGQATVPSDKISCDNGSSPVLEYLTTDPRTTGEMHPMFTP